MSSSKKLGEFGGEGSASEESFLIRTGAGFAKTVAGGLQEYRGKKEDFDEQQKSSCISLPAITIPNNN